MVEDRIIQHFFSKFGRNVLEAAKILIHVFTQTVEILQCQKKLPKGHGPIKGRF